MTALTHHAYYIEDSLSRFAFYAAIVHPFWSSAFERFGVDEARELIALSALKNYQDATFLMGASSITSEAQQALLKLFEEPQQGTTFVMLVPHGALLPTLKSRMLPYPGVVTEEASGGDAKKFLKMSGKERSDFLTKLLKDDDNVHDRVREFVNELEAVLAKTSSEKNRQGLEDIAMVRTYLADRSPSLKMLLEHLALSLPQV